MTLIISAVTSKFVVQASDRRVCLIPSGIHDNQANKIILYGDENALVSVAYTGVAYIGGVPTDEKLVEWILDGSANSERNGQAASLGFGITPITSIEDVIGVLYQKLRSYFAVCSATIRRYRFEVSVVGWERKHDIWLPFTTLFIKRENSRELRSRKYEMFRYPANAMLYISGGWKSSILGGDSFLRNYFDVSTKPHDESDYHFVIRRSIDLIKSASMKTPLIGPDVSAVLLHAPSCRGIFELKLSNPAKYCYYDKQTQENVYFSYSPWMIGPSFYAAPSIVVGTVPFRLGPHNIKLVGGKGGAFTKLYLGAQKRPKAPV